MSEVQGLGSLKHERERTSQVWQHVKGIWKTHTEFKTKTDVLIAALDILEKQLTAQEHEKNKHDFEYKAEHNHLRKIAVMFRANWGDQYFSKEELEWLKAHYPKVAERRARYFSKMSKV